VDDHSTDGTGDIARRIVADDARARVTSPPPLQSGWFGKQWACAHGASLAAGDLLLCTDADTWHAPDLIARAVTALRERGADLLTLLGTQEAEGFWVMVGQSAMFLGLMTLVGNAEAMSKSNNKWKKAANGQFLLMRRNVYDALGGHEAVRMHVAEDIMFARTWTAAGKSVQALVAPDHISTRMYGSLGELVGGWRKNAWAGSAFLWREYPVLSFFLRITVPFVPYLGWIPIIALLLGVAGVVSPWWTVFGAAGYIYETVVLVPIFRQMRFPAYCALIYPLGCVLVSYIFFTAVLKGGQTEWEGREYTVG
jgi:chlorobactene glucosyltransferase